MNVKAALIAMLGLGFKYRPGEGAVLEAAGESGLDATLRR
jgi:hypothetical protein